MSKTRAPARRRRIMLADVAGPILIFIAFLGFWYWLSYYGMAERRRFLVPPLHEVIQDGYLDWRNFSVMLKALWLTTQVALWGLGIAIVSGMPLAILMSQDPRPRAPPRHLVQLQLQRSGDRVHHHCELPDHQQHPLRYPVGGSGTSRPVHASPHIEVDTAAEIAAPRRFTRHIRGIPHLGRTLGDRRDRRRLLLP